MSNIITFTYIIHLQMSHKLHNDSAKPLSFPFMFKNIDKQKIPYNHEVSTDHV